MTPEWSCRKLLWIRFQKWVNPWNHNHAGGQNLEGDNCGARNSAVTKHVTAPHGKDIPDARFYWKDSATVYIGIRADEDRTGGFETRGIKGIRLKK